MKQHQGAAPRGPARAPARRPARAPRRVRRGRPRRPPASAAPRASLRAAHAQHDVQDTKSQPATGAPQAGATVLLDSVAPAGARCTVCACWASTQQQQLWRLHAASRPRPPHSRVPAWPAGCRGEVPQAARARAGGGGGGGGGGGAGRAPPPPPPPPPPLSCRGVAWQTRPLRAARISAHAPAHADSNIRLQGRPGAGGPRAPAPRPRACAVTASATAATAASRASALPAARSTAPNGRSDSSCGAHAALSLVLSQV